MVQLVVTESEEDPSAVVVHVAGDLDVTSVGELRDVVEAQFRAGRFNIALDVGSLSFLDSRGLGVLVGLLRVARGHGGDLRPACVPPRIRRLFTITNLDDVFELDEDIPGALAALAAPAVLPHH